MSWLCVVLSATSFSAALVAVVVAAAALIVVELGAAKTAIAGPEMPIGAPNAWALLAHCSTRGKNNVVAERFSCTQAAKPLDVAHRCPIHRTLRSEVFVPTAEALTDQTRG